MDTKRLAAVKKKFADWHKANKGEKLTPRHLKREAVALLEFYSRNRLAKELGVMEPTIRSWQRRILEVAHDARVYETSPRPPAHLDDPDGPSFIEVTEKALEPASTSGTAPVAGLFTAQPSLLLRRPDGGVLSVKGDLSTGQIRLLTRAFLGGKS